MDIERGVDGVDGMEDGETGFEGMRVELRMSMVAGVDCDIDVENSVRNFVGDLGRVRVFNCLDQEN